MLKKLYMLLRQNFMISLQFRAELVLWILIDILPSILMIFVWTAIFAGRDVVNGQTLSSVIQFYMLVVVIQRFTEAHFEGYRSQQIRDGKIDFYLVRPISYPLELLISHISGKVFSLFVFVPAVMLFYFFAKMIVPEFAVSIASGSLLPLTFLLTISYLAQFIIGLWIVYATFWIEGSQGMEHFKWIAVALFSGTLMPLAFLPGWLNSIINFLPFKYFYVIPIDVINGSYSMTMGDYLYAGLTVVLMWLISEAIWRSAQKAYASAGG